ncbi:hypothetical protein GCM10027033_26580 [Leucobacter ruminantium]
MWVTTGAAVVVAFGIGSFSVGTMQQLASAPATFVFAHRGFTGGGVENTISALDAAKSAGAEIVEMDVMQTKDKQFVVIHDPNLKRLAGKDLSVKDLTLDELTSITVHDEDGHSDTLASLGDYVDRAKEIGMKLLIEIKTGGLDTEDHVDLLVDELEKHDALESNMFHSLDPASVKRLKQLRPDLNVGYIMPFAGGGIPDTPANFIVVEEWTATEKMKQQATDNGLGFIVWTVNEQPSMRDHLRQDADGIITDHPDTARSIREEMDDSTGVTGPLRDALDRFITIN